METLILTAAAEPIPRVCASAVDMLLAAERPVILVGQGMNYGPAAKDLLTSPNGCSSVACSSSGMGAIDCTHPLALGLVARNGAYQANHAARQADVLLALGVRLDDRTRAAGFPAIRSISRLPNSSTSTSTRRRSPGIIR